MNQKIILITLVLLFSGLWAADKGLSDTIYTRDDKEIKGIIIEEYKDRILISTVNGENTILKSDIKELYFDTEEQNLIKLAEQARDRGDFIKAFVYYDKAFKISPDSKAAKDGVVFLQGYLFKKDMAKKEEAVSRHNEFEERSAGSVMIKTEEEIFREDIEKLKNTTGVVFSSSGWITRVENILPGSPAHEAGVKKGDILIAIWGRLVGYMSLQDVVETLLKKTSLETKCTIERTAELKSKEMGADLKMQFDGLTVMNVKDGSSAQDAGLKPGDIITSIDGQSTRYMPLKKALELIKRYKGGTVRLIFRREIVIWGREGG